VFAVGF
jgi:hypothetical protein